MKIGVLGVGQIGKSLVLKLSAAGHAVKAANSRGPGTITADTLAHGARAVTATEALTDVDVAILSIPLDRLPALAPLLENLPAGDIVMDTSNYYPQRNGVIGAIEAGQAESLWVVEQLDRPVVKAWNSLGAASLAGKGRPPGSPDRVALPVAADSTRDREVGMALVEDTGFDAIDAGPLAQSWRQQPGAPCYCTDLSRAEMAAALAAADRTRLPRRRDLALAAFMERLSEGGRPDPGYGVRISRALYL